jgi:hypothetical protein
MEQFHPHLKQVINIIEIIFNNGGTIAPIQTKDLTLIMKLERRNETAEMKFLRSFVGCT